MVDDSIKQAIMAECMELAEFLLEKNSRYGNSALEPINIFSGSDAAEGINVRIDDKLKRIRNARALGVADTEDSEKDLLGYLTLKRVLRRLGQ